MNVLIIGGGGREHALAWKLNQSSMVEQLYAIPGNGGIAEIAQCTFLPPDDFPALIRFVREQDIDFTVVGPEQPLVAGLVDAFEEAGLPVFGPNQAAAQMEGSKIFAKRLMKKYGIPTADFAEFDDYTRASQYLKTLPEGPVVVKADGLAAGKGSIVCQNKAEAEAALNALMRRRVFQAAGARVVIEECMSGPEVSIFAITDGRDYLTLTPAQDFKRALDNDQGKNTGGMGSYAPTVYLSEEDFQRSIREIIEPTLNALQSEGITYKGVLYAGLMLTESGPRVIEFNCRFGDPETQAVLPLLNYDLMEIFQAVRWQELGKIRLPESGRSAVCVVAASDGYPDAYKIRKLILGIEQAQQKALVFHAGTMRDNGGMRTSGGRVLGVTGVGDSLASAREQAYRAIERIRFVGMFYRKDIALEASQV